MVADLDFRARDQRRVDGERRAKLRPGLALETADELAARRLVKRHGCRDARLGDPFTPVDEITERDGDLWHEGDPIALEQQEQERANHLWFTFERGAERLDALLHGNGRVAESRDGESVEDRSEPFERRAKVADRAFVRPESKKRLRVAPRPGSGERQLALFHKVRGGFVERLLDQAAMLLGVDLAAQHAARREDDHARELRSELRERLVMELVRIFAAAFADAIGLGFRLRANIVRRDLGGLRRPLGDRLRLSPGLREETLDLGLELLAIGLRLLGQRQTLTDPAGAGREHRRDRAPQQSSHGVPEQEEIDDRDQHPERVHGRYEDGFLESGAEQHLQHLLQEVDVLAATGGTRRTHYGCVRKMSRIPTTSESTPSPSARPAPRMRLFRMRGAASVQRPIAADDFAVAMPRPRPTSR